jgi:hypothetical protein
MTYVQCSISLKISQWNISISCFKFNGCLVDSFCNLKLFKFQMETLLCSWVLVVGCKILPETTIGLYITGKCIVLELSKNKFKNIKNVSYVWSSTKTYIDESIVWVCVQIWI